LKRIPLLICLSLFCVSCSQVTILRTKELTAVRDSLSHEIAVLKKNIDEEMVREELHRVYVEITLKSMDEKLMQLSGNVTENLAKISEISKRTGLISTQMAEKARQDSLVATIKEQERLDLFSLAKSNYDKGNFSLAVNDFKDYIEKYPDSDDAKAALYWKAEASYAMNSLDNAKAFFQQYFKENRTEKFACAALYKLGLIFNKQSQVKNRDAMWDLLKKECPDSREAKLVIENQKK